MRSVAGMFRNNALWLLRRVVMAVALVAGLWAGQVYAQAPQGGPTIRDTVIEGNQRIELSTIQNYLTLQPGSPYSSAEADKSLKALFATGLFADVNLRLQGSSLIVRVTENPVINRILF